MMPECPSHLPEHIQPIRLPAEDVAVGESVTATGWGYNQTQGEIME